MWDRKYATSDNAGLEDIGFGFYHTGVELWGKEISFGHSKKFVSGVFSVNPGDAEKVIPNIRFKKSVEIAIIQTSVFRCAHIPNFRYGGSSRAVSATNSD